MRSQFESVMRRTLDGDGRRGAIEPAATFALAAAFLNAAFGFCLGCEMYGLLGRVRAVR